MERHPDSRAATREYALLHHVYEPVWRRYLRTTVARTLGPVELSGGERVLDVGCGTGLLLERLAERGLGLELHGIDATPEMLGRARRRLGQRALLRLGSADRLPYPDATFDLVTSTSVLHLLGGRHDAALADWARVLSPGGRLVVTDWRGEAPSTRARLRALRLLGLQHHEPLSSDALAELIRRHGIAVSGLTAYRAGTWAVMTAWGTA
jgi:ubiquinone/menaquinone biosynthesis C-methylase UbiE